VGSTKVANGTAVETAPEPKYWQLRTVLVRALDTEFQTGEVLPNERDLSARFGVARATLRQALDQLELEGRLVRRRGIGTLVAAPRMGVPMAEATDNHFGTGGVGWRIIDADYTTAPAAVAAALGVPADTCVHLVRRLRMMRGQAIGAETLYAPDAVVPHVPGAFIKHSLAESSRARSVLRQLSRLDLDGESRAVELGVAEDEAARLLERPPGIPVLVVTATYRAQGKVAAVGVATYRADTCRLTFGESGMLDVTPMAVGAPAEVRAAS